MESNSNHKNRDSSLKLAIADKWKKINTQKSIMQWFRSRINNVFILSLPF